MRRVLTILFAFIGLGSLAFFAIQRLVQHTQPTLALEVVQADYPLADHLPEHIPDNNFFAGIRSSNDIYKGQKAYDEAQYQLAIVHFDRAVKRHPGRFDLMLYHALSFLYLEDYGSAIPLLQQIANHPDEPFAARQALWYLSLAQLHNGNVDDSRNTLSRLITLVSAVDENEHVKDWIRLHRKLERVGK